MALTPDEIEQVIDKLKEMPGAIGIYEVNLYDNVTEKSIYMQNGPRFYAPPVPGMYLTTERVEEREYHTQRRYIKTLWLVERVEVPSDSNGDPETIRAYVVKVRESEVR